MRQTATEVLFGLRDLINESIQTIAEEWSSHGAPDDIQDSTVHADTGLPSPRLYEASKVVIGAAGMLQAILKDPKEYLRETALQFLESRALHAASVARIPDILHEAALKGRKDGLTAVEIAAVTGYDADKCRRTMGLLATSHIFTQTGPDRFSNNRISCTLVRNEPLSNYIDIFGAECYSASQHFIEGLKNTSHNVEDAAFTKDTVYNSQGKTYWAYNDTNPVRHDLFASAMAGSAQSNIPSILQDYPWDKLGNAQLVDVGGGVGSLSLPLLERFPQLSVVIQDRTSVISQAKDHWQRSLPEAIDANRVTFQVADFFMPNGVKNADAYLLRYIMHDWNDDACVQILSALRGSMSPVSRALILETLLIPAWKSDEDTFPNLATAPSPLLPNYGTAHRFIHSRDMNMMTLINGIERTAAEMNNIVERAGMKVAKIWSCRGTMHITECVLPP